MGLRKIAEAEEQVATGDKDVAAGRWAVGIEHYRNAWNLAIHLQIDHGIDGVSANDKP